MDGGPPHGDLFAEARESFGAGAIPMEELRRLYAAYRIRQARSLLGLVPRSAIRPLYRRALEGSAEPPDADGGSSEDPMAALVGYCESILPLPPFDVWLADLRRNAEAHWRDLEASADTPSSTAPATLDSRRLRFQSLSWKAHLRGFRDRDAWRGFIAFEETGVAPRRTHRTALIFREDTVQDLRDRFRGFETVSLEAFLRSSLP